MKKIALLLATAGAMGVVGLSLASTASASADVPAPPIAEGTYHVTANGTDLGNTQIRYDCGEGCFRMDDAGNSDPGREYRWDGVSWRSGAFWFAPGDSNLHKDGLDYPAVLVRV